MISKKAIKSIFSDNNTQVSADVVNCIDTLLERMGVVICEELWNGHRQLNKLYRFHHLPSKKRIDLDEYLRMLPQLLIVIQELCIEASNEVQ